MANWFHGLNQPLAHAGLVQAAMKSIADDGKYISADRPQGFSSLRTLTPIEARRLNGKQAAEHSHPAAQGLSATKASPEARHNPVL
ncbi:MAG: hypothetical protein ABI642_06955 [Polaromonas sp.]